MNEQVLCWNRWIGIVSFFLSIIIATTTAKCSPPYNRDNQLFSRQHVQKKGFG